jgi:hypothetical protein
MIQLAVYNISRHCQGAVIATNLICSDIVPIWQHAKIWFPRICHKFLLALEDSYVYTMHDAHGGSQLYFNMAVCYILPSFNLFYT